MYNFSTWCLLQGIRGTICEPLSRHAGPGIIRPIHHTSRRVNYGAIVGERHCVWTLFFFFSAELPLVR